MFQQQLDDSPQLISQSARRLLCHCAKTQSCHVDVIIVKFRAELQERTTGQRPPTSQELRRIIDW